MSNPSFEIDMIPAVIVVASAVVTLLLQLLLCFKAKRTWVRILPVALLTASVIAFYICTKCSRGWDAIGYLFFALLSGFLVAVCGIGWGIWVIVTNKT